MTALRAKANAIVRRRIAWQLLGRCPQKCPQSTRNDAEKWLGGRADHLM